MNIHASKNAVSNQLVIDLNKEELLRLKQMLESALENEKFLEETRISLKEAVEKGASKEEAILIDTLSNKCHPSTNMFTLDGTETKIGFNPIIETWEDSHKEELK